MSLYPELNKKIYTGFLLAPAAFVGQTTMVNRFLAPLIYNAQYLTSPVLRGKLGATNTLKDLTGLSLNVLCDPSALACSACGNLLFLYNGYDGPQTNYTNLGLFLSVFPDAISTKSIIHYAQSITTSQFRQFDYGNPLINLREYGQFQPPSYDLKSISAPAVILYGVNDNLCVRKDVLRTAHSLNPNALKEIYKVPWHLFNHYDFATAKDSKILFIDFIGNIMRNSTYE